MGYTHYWDQSKPFSAESWEQVSPDLRAIVEFATNVQGVALWDGLGECVSKPEFGAFRIAFNGARDDAHETFEITRAADSNFCKTARKPYDIAVTACLCYLATVAESHCVTTDGHGRDWLAGLELARQALPQYANVLDIPRPILERDRWLSPWFDVRPAGYSLDCCVDGFAYAQGPKGVVYRFDSHLEAAQWATSHVEKPVTVRSHWAGANQRKGGRSVFSPSGCFDTARWAKIETQQRKALKALLADVPPERAVQPPAFVRPGELVAIAEPLAWTLGDLLALAEKAA